MVVCHCENVNDRTIDAAICAGADDISRITAACRAGGNCHGCHAVIEELIEQRSEPAGRRIDLAVA